MSDTKPYPSILQGFLLIVPFVLFTVLLAIAYIVIEEQFSFKTTAASLLELIAYVLVLAALIYFANKRRKYSRITAGFNFNIVPLKIIIISVAVVFSANIVTELFFYFFPPGESFVEFYEEAMSGGIPSIVAAVIAAPVLEEILMRGIILDGFLKRYTPAKAIIWSALIFAAFHLNLWQGVSAFTFGLLAGWLYWKTRSLSLCILLHAFGNGMSVVQYKAIGTISLTEYLGTGRYTVAFVTALILLIGCLRYMDIYLKKRQVSVVGNSAELPV